MVRRPSDRDIKFIFRILDISIPGIETDDSCSEYVGLRVHDFWVTRFRLTMFLIRWVFGCREKVMIAVTVECKKKSVWAYTGEIDIAEGNKLVNTAVSITKEVADQKKRKKDR